MKFQQLSISYSTISLLDLLKIKAKQQKALRPPKRTKPLRSFGLSWKSIQRENLQGENSSAVSYLVPRLVIL